MRELLAACYSLIVDGMDPRLSLGQRVMQLDDNLQDIEDPTRGRRAQERQAGWEAMAG